MSEPNLAFRQWTLRRVMALVAMSAVLLALFRNRFVFGFVVGIGLIVLFVGDCVRRRRYQGIAWFLIFYPALPLGTLYLKWGLIGLKLDRRSSTTGVLDGVIGFSDIGAMVCLVAYFGCVSLVAGMARDQASKFPGLRQAAKRVLIFLPIAWATLLAFTIWDPFGMLGYMAHF